MSNSPAGDLPGLRVALLQTDPVLGEVETNLAELQEQLRQVPHTDLAVAPELARHGYHLGALATAPQAELDAPDERHGTVRDEALVDPATAK